MLKGAPEGASNSSAIYIAVLKQRRTEHVRQKWPLEENTHKQRGLL